MARISKRKEESSFFDALCDWRMGLQDTGSICRMRALRMRLMTDQSSPSISPAVNSFPWKWLLRSMTPQSSRAHIMLSSSGSVFRDILGTGSIRINGDVQRSWPLKAADLLARRPEYIAQIGSQLYAPSASRIDDKWLLQSLLYYAPQDSGSAYWLPVLEKLHISLSHYNGFDLKGLADTRFVDTLFWCYSVLIGNRVTWAVEDLKNCIRNGAPDLWKALHPLSFFSTTKGIWRKIGGD